MCDQIGLSTNSDVNTPRHGQQRGECVSGRQFRAGAALHGVGAGHAGQRQRRDHPDQRHRAGLRADHFQRRPGADRAAGRDGPADDDPPPGAVGHAGQQRGGAAAPAGGSQRAEPGGVSRGPVPAPGSTNGSLAQWHFFIFTNVNYGTTNTTLHEQRRNNHASIYTNAIFATFLPPTLTIPNSSPVNVSYPAANNADLDLYVSTDPALFNLDPAAVAGASKVAGAGRQRDGLVHQHRLDSGLLHRRQVGEPAGGRLCVFRDAGDQLRQFNRQRPDHGFGLCAAGGDPGQLRTAGGWRGPT